MKVINVRTLVLTVLFALVSYPALAQPTFQVYTPDWDYAGDYYEDEDTWFISESSSFDLLAVVAFHPQDEDPIEDVKLLVSVPDGDLALALNSITITLEGVILDPIFTSVDTTFPDGATFNSHYPVQDPVSDFLVYNIGDFTEAAGDIIYDYNAEDPDNIDIPTGSIGEVKILSVEVSGLDWVHFDIYGLVNGKWEISPGSHDVTYIPAPGAVFLGGIGIALVGWLKRRRAL